MAYSARHTAQFYDIGNHLWEIEIDSLNYSGSSSAITKMGVPPLTFDMGKTTQNPYEKPVNDTRATLLLQSNSLLGFSHLYSNNAKQNRVTIKHKSNVFFKGFIVGDRYAEPYRPAPFFVQFQVIDGLKILENRTWDKSGQMSAFNILVACLAETGLELDFVLSLQTSKTTPLPIEADPFLQLTQGVEHYADREFSYYEVLQDVLRVYGMVIKQAAGKWYVTQLQEKTKGTYITRTFNSAGTQTASGSITPIQNATAEGTSNVCTILTSSVLNINPAFKSITVTQHLSSISNLVKNGTFEDYSNGVFANWQATGNVDQYTNDENSFVLVRGAESNATPDANTDYITQYLGEIEMNSALKLLLDYSVMGSEESTLYGDVYIKLKIGSYYLFLSEDAQGVITGGWTFQENFIKLDTVQARAYNNVEFERFELLIPNVTQGGTGQIFLYQVVNKQVSGGVTIAGAMYDNIVLKAVNTDGTEVENTVEYKRSINANSSYVPSEIDVYFGDAPNIENAANTYNNIILDNGTPTTAWLYGNAVTTWSGKLLDVLTRQIEAMFANERLMLRANMVSDVLDFNTLLTDTARLGTKKFEIIRASFNAKHLAWNNIELLELSGEMLADFDGDDFDNDDFFTD